MHLTCIINGYGIMHLTCVINGYGIMHLTRKKYSKHGTDIIFYGCTILRANNVLHLVYIDVVMRIYF